MIAFLYIFCVIINAVYASMPLAILHVEGTKASADLCALYNPYYSAIPTHLSETPKYKVFIPDPPHGCEDYVDVRDAQNSCSFVMNDGNCTQFEKLRKAYSAQAKQVLLISEQDSLNDFAAGSTIQHKQVHLSVGMISESAWKSVKDNLGIPLFAQLYHPHDPLFDPNLVVIWCIAVFTVVVGAYCCGSAFEKSGSNVIDQNFLDLEHSYNSTKKGSLLMETEHEDEDNEKEDFPITTVIVFVFIFMICTVLLLLYFFYKYLIYVVIGLFAVASVSGTFECLSGLLSFINCGRCRVPENNLPILKNQPEIRNIFLFLACLGLSVYWVIIRHDPMAWILQDFLGICFCINLLKIIRLPNLKISTILLLALLVYDIFFVFITPFFSARGKSVMVEVATGNGSNEQLPMVIKVPKIIKTALSLCERPYSLLGFGDILLPGLFVAFCHNFDVLAKTRYKVYFIATSIAYGLGLVATFTALILMKIGQPALLYLAPSILLACFIVGYARGELKSLWTGTVDRTKELKDDDDSEKQTLLRDR